MPTVAMLSMKHAARRPRPPLPSAASGSSSADRIEIDGELAQREPHRLRQAEIAQRLLEQTADQEFERKIIDALAAGAEGLARRGHPAVDDAVAHGKDGGEQPIVVLRDDRVLADRIGELCHDLAARSEWASSRRRLAAGKDTSPPSLVWLSTVGAGRPLALMPLSLAGARDLDEGVLGSDGVPRVRSSAWPEAFRPQPPRAGVVASPIARYIQTWREKQSALRPLCGPTRSRI